MYPSSKSAFLDECRIERTPRKLRRWVDEQFQIIGATREGKSAIRLRTGPLKQFVEEVYPLSLWAATLYGEREDVTIQWAGDTSPFDARIRIFSHSQLHESQLEITVACNGHEDHLRMAYANEHGSVPLTGAVTSIGTRVNRRIEVTFEARSHGAITGDVCRHVRDAIKGKVRKTYPSRTSLLVMVDDAHFEVPDDWNDLKTSLVDLSTGQVQGFETIYLCGWRGRIAMPISSNNAGLPRVSTGATRD
jgi:hypothetical protein